MAKSQHRESRQPFVGKRQLRDFRFADSEKLYREIRAPEDTCECACVRVCVCERERALGDVGNRGAYITPPRHVTSPTQHAITPHATTTTPRVGAIWLKAQKAWERNRGDCELQNEELTQAPLEKSGSCWAALGVDLGIHWPTWGCHRPCLDTLM